MTSGEQQLWQAHLERGARLAELRAAAEVLGPTLRALARAQRRAGVEFLQAVEGMRRLGVALGRQVRS